MRQHVADKRAGTRVRVHDRSGRPRGWVYFAGANSANAGRIAAADEDGNAVSTPGGFGGLGTNATNGMVLVP